MKNLSKTNTFYAALFYSEAKWTLAKMRKVWAACRLYWTFLPALCDWEVAGTAWFSSGGRKVVLNNMQLFDYDPRYKKCHWVKNLEKGRNNIVCCVCKPLEANEGSEDIPKPMSPEKDPQALGSEVWPKPSLKQHLFFQLVMYVEDLAPNVKTSEWNKTGSREMKKPLATKN